MGINLQSHLLSRAVTDVEQHVIVPSEPHLLLDGPSHNVPRGQLQAVVVFLHEPLPLEIE